MADDKVRLNAADLDLIKQAKAAGATVMTYDKALGAPDPDLVSVSKEDIEAMRASLAQRLADIDTSYPSLIGKADPDLVTAVAAKVLGAVHDHLRQPGSFRFLIYDRIGLTTSAYVPTCQAGGLDVSNYAVAAHRLAGLLRDALSERGAIASHRHEELSAALAEMEARFS